MSKELVITKVVKNIEEVQIMFDEFIKINKPFNKNKLKKALLFIHTDKIDRIKALFNKYIIDEFHKINLLINDINSGTVLTTRNRIIDFLDRFPIFISTLKKIEDEEIIKEKETIRKEAEALKLKNETELKRREALKRKEETERELKRIQEKQRQEEEKERQRRQEEEKEAKIQRQEEEKTKHKEYEKNKIKIREEIQEKSQAYYNALTEFTRATTEQLKATIDHIEAYAEKENLYYVDAKEKSLTPEKSTTPKKSPTTQKIPSALSSPLSEDYIFANEYPMENDILTNELRELLKKVKKVEETGQEEFKQGTGQEEFKQGTGEEEFKQGIGEEKFNEEPEREEFNEEPEREEFKEQSERKKHSRSNPYSHKFDIGIKIKKEEQKAKIIEAKISNFTKENKKKIKKEEKKLENANIELEKANKELENANIELKEVKNNKDVGVYPKSVLIKKNMARRKTLVKLHQVRKLGRSIKIRGQLLVNVATDKQFTNTLRKSVRRMRRSSIIKKLNKNNQTKSMPNLLPRRPKVQILNEEPVYHQGQPVPVTARSSKKSLKSNRPVLMEVDEQGNAPIFNSQPKQQLSPQPVTQSVPMDIDEQIPQSKLNDFNLNINTPFLISQTKSRLNPSLASQSVPMINEIILSRPNPTKGK